MNNRKTTNEAPASAERKNLDRAIANANTAIKALLKTIEDTRRATRAAHVALKMEGF